MANRPLTEGDMALIAVLCQDGETRCAKRVFAARETGDHDAEKSALADLTRYRSLRYKMFALD